MFSAIEYYNQSTFNCATNGLIHLFYANNFNSFESFVSFYLLKKGVELHFCNQSKKKNVFMLNTFELVYFEQFAFLIWSLVVRSGIFNVFLYRNQNNKNKNLFLFNLCFFISIFVQSNEFFVPFIILNKIDNLNKMVSVYDSCCYIN